MSLLGAFAAVAYYAVYSELTPIVAANQRRKRETFMGQPDFSSLERFLGVWHGILDNHLDS